jgi:hypothetical protein
MGRNKSLHPEREFQFTQHDWLVLCGLRRTSQVKELVY